MKYSRILVIITVPFLSMCSSREKEHREPSAPMAVNTVSEAATDNVTFSGVVERTDVMFEIENCDTKDHIVSTSPLLLYASRLESGKEVPITQNLQGADPVPLTVVELIKLSPGSKLVVRSPILPGSLPRNDARPLVRFVLKHLTLGYFATKDQALVRPYKSMFLTKDLTVEGKIVVGM